MVGNQTILSPPQEEGNAAGGGGKGGSASRATEKKPQNFTFDKSYWSAGPRDEPGYCSQQVSYLVSSTVNDKCLNGFIIDPLRGSREGTP
jgi:hypothetical protein